MSELTAVINFATTKHSGQFRKHNRPNGVKLPFITHPLEVMKKLWTWGIDDWTTLAAATCHDLMEDTEVTKSDIFYLFGEQVANIVEELTFIWERREAISPFPTEYTDLYKQEKAAAKAAYMDSFAGKSDEALVIKLADRICNTRDMVLTNPDKAKGYFEKAKSLIRAWEERRPAIADRFGWNTIYRIEAELVEVTTLTERI
jgi:GTP diphosphokinase / guanosine-3',5'-bis(diphosphate) 3'-diphosphatase